MPNIHYDIVKVDEPSVRIDKGTPIDIVSIVENASSYSWLIDIIGSAKWPILIIFASIIAFVVYKRFRGMKL